MKKLFVGILAVVMMFSLCACGGNGGSNDDVDYSEIIKDADAGTVSVYGTVNGMFFDQSTMHFMVYEEGSVAEKSMIKAFADSQDFYDALVEVGGQPGNETTDKIKDGEFVKGQEIEVTMTWDGQDEPIAWEDFTKLKDGSRPDAKFLFGGNKQNNETAGSGCIACNNSCWAGIISNGAYAYGAVDAEDPAILLNDKVAPEDGTVVKVTFTLK